MPGLIAANQKDTHRSLIDRETPMHAAVGCGAGICGVSVTAALLLTVAAEIGYHAVKDGTSSALYDKRMPAESLGNYAADIIATGLGYTLGRYIRSRWQSQ